MTHEDRILRLERAVTKLDRYRIEQDKKIARLELFMLNQIEHNTVRGEFERTIANKVAFIREPIDAARKKEIDTAPPKAGRRPGRPLGSKNKPKES